MKNRLLALAFLILFVILAFASCGKDVSFKLNFVVDGKVYATVDTAGQETIAIPENPTKAGDEFDGWYWDKDEWNRPFTANSLLDVPLSSDMSVYAKWKSDEKKTLDATTGNSDPVVIVVPGDDKVQFHLNFTVDGAIYDTVDTAGNAIVSLPQNPVKEGYSFDGWFWDYGTWERPFTANSLLNAPLSSDMNVYAKWSAIDRYSITYVLGGGTNSENNPATYTVEDAVTLAAPTRTGYTFTGWSDGGTITAGSTGEKIFTASWAIVDYPITYTLNGGTNAEGNPATYTVENAVTLAVPTRADYFFSGWTWDGQAEPQTSVAILTGSTGAKTFVANWYKKQFIGLSFADAEFVYDGEPKSLALVGAPEGATVAYSGNGQTATGTYTVTATVSMEGYETKVLTATLKITNDPSAANLVSATGFAVDGSALSMTLPNTTESYSFLGQITVSPKATWQISTDIYGVNSIPTKTVPLNAGDNTFYLLVVSENGEGISLYTVTLRRRPIWTLTFDPNGGSAVTEQKVEEDMLATPPTTTRTGYTFAAWDYDFAQPVKGDVTITAKWTPNTDTAYTVEYYLENAAGTGYDKTSEPKTGATAASVTAEQKTYEHFTYQAAKSTPSGEIAPDDSLVLKMYYDRETYTVSFLGNGGTLQSGDTTQTVRYGNSAAIPTYVRNGYSFAGWDDVSGCAVVESNLTVTAQWTPVVYPITYDLSEGTNAQGNPATYTIEDDVELLNPTWECGVFLGWYDASGTQVTNLLGRHENLTLTAKWECYFTINNSGAITGVSDYCKQNVTELEIPAALNGVEITSISANAFTNCTNLTSITIPDTVTSIGNRAFSGCSGLTSITIPVDVTSIGDFAFSGCSGLTSVTIPDSVTSIGRYAFSGCSGLTSVNIPDSVTSIGWYAFYNCSGLTSVTIPDGVTRIGYQTFYNCSGLTSVTIPDGVTSIESYAFSGCSGLTSVTIGNGVTSIEDYAFYNCSSLTSLTIPDSVTSIGMYAFSGCSGLTSVTIGNGVTSIGDGAFYNCSSLTSITIPSNVKSIGRYAFSGCSKLTSVTFAFTNWWRVTYPSSGTSTKITVTDASANAIYLTSSYTEYDWYCRY